MHLLVLITNLVTIIQLPTGLCYDLGVMGASFDTGTTNPVYGIKVDVLNSRNELIAGAWAMEAYSPPMTETVPVILTPEAAAVRCEIFGPDLRGKWHSAYFTVMLIQPAISITKNNAKITLAWPSYETCWKLEAQIPGQPWAVTALPAHATNSAMFFRLIRVGTNPR